MPHPAQTKGTQLKIKPTTLLASLVLFFPTSALANADTALMMASYTHLMIGNFFIGFFEGLLLALVFGLKKWRTIGLFILANYFSAWIGAWITHSRLVREWPIDVNNAWTFFWVMVVITYTLTLVLEFPFVSFALRRDSQWRRNAIRGSLIIQTASYALIFGWYWNASETSLYTKNDIVPLSAITLPQEVVIYFINKDDGDVYSMPLAPTSVPHKIATLNSANVYDWLFIQPTATGNDHWQLMARLLNENHPKVTSVTVAGNIVGETTLSGQNPSDDKASDEHGWSTYRKIQKLGRARNTPWQFNIGDWPDVGLHGTNSVTQAKAGFSFETPFAAWLVSNVTILPNDIVLLELGPNQICVFDPATHRVALVTKGRGPVAVISQQTLTNP